LSIKIFYWDLDPILKEGKVRIRIKSLWELRSLILLEQPFLPRKNVTFTLRIICYYILLLWHILLYYHYYILLLYSTFLLTQSSHFNNDIILWLLVHLELEFLSFKISKIRVCPVHCTFGRKTKWHCHFVFWLFQQFLYVFSIFIITWMILITTTITTTTHTHCTYHIMKIYNNLVE